MTMRKERYCATLVQVYSAQNDRNVRHWLCRKNVLLGIILHVQSKERRLEQQMQLEQHFNKRALLFELTAC